MTVVPSPLARREVVSASRLEPSDRVVTVERSRWPLMLDEVDVVAEVFLDPDPGPVNWCVRYADGFVDGFDPSDLVVRFVP